MTYNILIAEDDRDIAQLLKLYLESSGYRTVAASDGEEAFALVETEDIHLAVLDIMMPKLDGYQLTMKIRERGYDFPIIFLSAKVEDNDKILGLNLGGDDYMTKPFNPLEIIARVKSSLRRAYELNKPAKEQPSRLTNGELTMDFESMTVMKGDTHIGLTPTEFKILALFMRSPGSVFTKTQICQSINEDFYESDENAVIVHISKIREKLGDDSKNPAYIKTIRGLGYKIEKK
ncbi:MAG: response regulator transcription factor [Emergencia sp.]|nr:response regulator transcription factor [Emergencia sp.]